MDSDEVEKAKIKMLNGRSVTSALAFLKSDATQNNLLKCFTTLTNAPQNIVRKEIKRILDCGVANGFIEKRGRKYAFTDLENRYQTDCDDTSDDIAYIRYFNLFRAYNKYAIM